MGEDLVKGFAGVGERTAIGGTRINPLRNYGMKHVKTLKDLPADTKNRNWHLAQGHEWVSGKPVNAGGKFQGGGKWMNPEYNMTYEDQGLNGLGYASHALGYGTAAAGTAGAYTLGSKMFGGDKGEAQSSHDSNGILSKGYDEELGKLRQKINQDYLAGDKAFSMAKYQNMRKNAKWIDTAIAEIGIDKYKQLRRQLMTGEGGMDAQKFHSIMTDAVVHDDEAAAQAATEPYVLPGISRNAGGQGRFIVIAPMKGKKGGETKYHALKYGINDLEDNQQQQGQSQQ